MISIIYVEVFDKENPSLPNPEIIANELQDKLYELQFKSGRFLRFISSNFLGTKQIPKDNTNGTIYPFDSGIVYQYMLFFDERFN